MYEVDQGRMTVQNEMTRIVVNYLVCKVTRTVIIEARSRNPTSSEIADLSRPRLIQSPRYPDTSFQPPMMK